MPFSSDPPFLYKRSAVLQDFFIKLKFSIVGVGMLFRLQQTRLTSEERGLGPAGSAG